MEIKELLLLMSASSVLALTIPENILRVLNVEIEAREDSTTNSASDAASTPSNTLLAKSLSGSNVSTLTGAIHTSSLANLTAARNRSNQSHWIKDYNFDKYTYSLGVCDLGAECNRDQDNDDEDDNDDAGGNSSYPTVHGKSYPIHLNATKRSNIMKRGDRHVVPFANSQVPEHRNWRPTAQPYFGTLNFYRGPRKNWDRENFQLENEDDETDPTVVNTERLDTTRGTVTEHPVELVVVAQIARAWTNGDPKKEAAFIEQWERKLDADGEKYLAKKYSWGKQALKNAGKEGLTFGDVIFHVLGSTANPGPNVPAGEKLNSMKEKFWAEHEARGESARKELWKKILAGKTSPNIIHQWNRDMLSVFSYFNNEEIKAHLVKERTELIDAFSDYKKFTGFDWKTPGKLTGSIGKGMGEKMNMGSFVKKFLKKKVPSIEKSSRDFLVKFNREAEDVLNQLHEKVAHDAAILKDKEKGSAFDTQAEYDAWLAENEQNAERYEDDLNEAKDEFDTIDDQYEKQEHYIDTVAQKALNPALSLKEATKVRTKADWKNQLKTYYSLIDKRRDAGDKVYEENMWLESTSSEAFEKRAEIIYDHLQGVKDIRAHVNELVGVPNFAESNLGFTMDQLEITDDFEEGFDVEDEEEEEKEDEEGGSCARGIDRKCVKKSNGDGASNKKLVPGSTEGPQAVQEHGGSLSPGTEGSRPESEIPKEQTPDTTGPPPENIDPGRVVGGGIHGI